MICAGKETDRLNTSGILKPSTKIIHFSEISNFFLKKNTKISIFLHICKIFCNFAATFRVYKLNWVQKGIRKTLNYYEYHYKGS